MAYVGASVLAIVCIALRSASSELDFTNEYDAKVCNNEPTCNLTSTPGLPPDRLTLEKRDCMCDFECVQYKDCCTDSQYFNTTQSDSVLRTITCSESKVYMITSCAPDYAHQETKRKCAKALLPLDETDFLINIPVTNTAKRLTYANAYCARCNHNDNFTLWNQMARCAEVPAGYLTSATAPQNRISAPESSTTPTSSSASSNKTGKVSLNFNPGSVSGGTVPTSGLSSKTLNRTIGSQTGLFGAKIGRSKRQTRKEPHLDFLRYASKVNDILKSVKWDPNMRELVGKYDGKDFICRFTSTMPVALEKYTRKCVAHLISECPGNAEANKLCQSYTQIVYDWKTMQPYRNRDCARCYSLTDANLHGCPVPVLQGASETIFGPDTKGNANNDICSNSAAASMFC